MILKRIRFPHGDRDVLARKLKMMRRFRDAAKDPAESKLWDTLSRDELKSGKKALSEWYGAKNFSKHSSSLPDSRIGIGWIQDGNGKVDSEKYFKIGKEAAERAEKEGKSDEEIIKSAKKAVSREVGKDNSGKLIGRTLKNTAIGGTAGYILSKSPEIIENRVGTPLPISPKTKQLLSSHSRKIALAAGILGASVAISKEAPRISKKKKAAQLGIEINTKDRLKRKKK